MRISVTVDEVGRIVLPKSIREAIGVFGRTEVAVEVVGQSARITAPEPAPGAVSRQRGRLVCSEPLPKAWDSGQVVMQSRERRIRR